MCAEQVRAKRFADDCQIVDDLDMQERVEIIKGCKNSKDRVDIVYGWVQCGIIDRHEFHFLLLVGITNNLFYKEF